MKNHPPKQTDTLTNYLISHEKGNRTEVLRSPREGAQKAVLNYRVIAEGERYCLLEVDLLTGRKHQIRAQLSSIGCPIKGDLKYGAPRSNVGGGISLQSHRICFEHPVSHIKVDVTAPVPNEPLWQALAAEAEKNSQKAQNVFYTLLYIEVVLHF